MRVVGALVVVMGVMTALVAYSPTLYRRFCAATGYGGTTQRADTDSVAVSDRVIAVRFDTNIAPDLPWRFEPAQREVKVHLGEEKLVFFTAENPTDQPIVGHATFNVTPDKTGTYFKRSNASASTMNGSMLIRRSTCQSISSSTPLWARIQMPMT